MIRNAAVANYFTEFVDTVAQFGFSLQADGTFDDPEPHPYECKVPLCRLVHMLPLPRAQASVAPFSLCGLTDRCVQRTLWSSRTPCAAPLWTFLSVTD